MFHRYIRRQKGKIAERMYRDFSEWYNDRYSINGWHDRYGIGDCRIPKSRAPHEMYRAQRKGDKRFLH